MKTKLPNGEENEQYLSDFFLSSFCPFSFMFYFMLRHSKLVISCGLKTTVNSFPINKYNILDVLKAKFAYAISASPSSY